MYAGLYNNRLSRSLYSCQHSLLRCVHIEEVNKHSRRWSSWRQVYNLSVHACARYVTPTSNKADSVAMRHGNSAGLIAALLPFASLLFRPP